MNSTEIVSEPKIKLSEAAIKEIERILTSDKTAKITPTRNGVSIYSEKLKKIYTQS